MGEKTLRRTDTQELHATATTCAEPHTNSAALLQLRAECAVSDL